MGNWRVVLLVGAVVAVVLVGASLWVHDNPPTQTVLAGSLTPYTDGGVPVKAKLHKETVPNQGLADQRARYLRYLAFAVVAVTLASIPLLRERERRQAA
jgi:energy-converting hydrogenase Eha subunit F